MRQRNDRKLKGIVGTFDITHPSGWRRGRDSCLDHEGELYIWQNLYMDIFGAEFP